MLQRAWADRPLEDLPSMDEVSGMLINPHNSRVRQMASDSFSVLEKQELINSTKNWESELTNRMWQMYGDGRITPQDAGAYKIPNVLE